MARKFLYLVALVIVLILAGAIALAIWSREATEIAFVPRGEFVDQAALDANAYNDPVMWYSRPGIGIDDPARYQPAVAQPAPDPATLAPAPDAPAAERSLPSPDPLATTGPARAGEPAEADAPPPFAVFFVHPTSYIRTAADAQWNAALGDAEAEDRARLFIRGLASPFNRADEIWAPKYRQAVAGAFLTARPEADKAIALAYRDVAQAFAFFVASAPEGKPIVLVGHSQGAAHVLRLYREAVAGTPLAARVAAVYAPGWPVSPVHDLPALGLQPCRAADQPACLLTWASFADGGDPSLVMTRYEAIPGFDGKPRGDGPILCVNPLTGTQGASAPASANLGTLIPNGDLTAGELVAGAVPASCDDRGLLMIGPAPDLGPGVLPVENYHVYDIPLFWKNLQDDVVRRVRAWTAQARS